MIMNLRKRGLALLMCICMIFTLLPFSVFADGGTGGPLGKILLSRGSAQQATQRLPKRSMGQVTAIPFG